MLRAGARGCPWITAPSPSLCARAPALGDREPILVAVDDVQWLDASSSAALAFALRRLPTSPVLVLLARRPPTARTPQVEGASLPGSRAAGAGGAAERRRPCTVCSSRPSRHELRAADPCCASGSSRAETRSSRWNWRGFWARTAARRTRSRSEDPRGPAGCEARRAARPGPAGPCPSWQRSARSPESMLQRAGSEPSVVQPALVAHVIERIDGTIRFTHPLLASVVYRDLGEQRWRVHAAIADWPRIPWSGPVTLPCRRTSRMPRSQPCSTTRWGWPSSAGRWPPRRSSPSVPSG